MASKSKPAKSKSGKSKSKKAPTKKPKAAAQVNTWQDDPISKLPTIQVPAPVLSKAPLRLKIKGTAVPVGLYTTGTAEFRYWNAAAALRRGADFWAPVLGVTRWQPGAVLPVGLDEGKDLNAYYDRTELAFFHDTAGGKVVYSGESPDVACHELGHACLDAHRPELFDAPYIEAGSFHESFGDMSAILSALQLPSVRAVAMAGIKGRKSSQLSRLAEQLGWALRQTDPTLVNKDCLRNAYNNFAYVDPQTLPDDAPASQLCAEVHSFSRVFTGAFYDILSGMLKIRSSTPKDADLVAVAADAAKLLSDATTAAPVQPDYYAQVASHMIDADTARFGGKYRSALTATFVKRKIIPPQAVHGLKPATGKGGRAASIAAAPAAKPPKPQIHKVALPAKEFGLGETTLIVDAPAEQQRFPTAAAAILHKNVDTAGNVQQATHRFVKMLFARDRVEKPSQPHAAAPAEHGRHPRTHALVETAEGMKLVRRRFDCGQGC
jgi:hypothetical protein